MHCIDFITWVNKNLDQLLFLLYQVLYIKDILEFRLKLKTKIEIRTRTGLKEWMYFILGLVINVEIADIATSFLAAYWDTY